MANNSNCGSPSASRWSYDVFLSFRGEDTRKNVVQDLYTALLAAGINTFRDDEELPRGEEISPALLKAIKESRVSVIVFSKNYAFSRWCLDELAQIIECRRAKTQYVLPVFFNIDPSDVRKQTGTFAKAFSDHEIRFKGDLQKVKRWRDAVTEAGLLSGWDLRNVAQECQAKFIKKIVGEVSSKVNHTYVNIAVHPVGLETPVKDVKLLLSTGSDDVRVIGIYGMGGIGKTTLAKAVYNEIFLDFDGSCFLANVRSESTKNSNGLLSLQERLLSRILWRDNYKFDDIHRGINLIKGRLCLKRVLIVLDDVDDISQFNALAGGLDWFGPGSRIIVTTRDEHLLNDQLGHFEKYMVQKLNWDHSMELFSWHAFRMTLPSEDFVNLSKFMVTYAKGLPLALEVLGSYLRGRNKEQWKSALRKFKRTPHDPIQHVLKVSFDALDQDAKEVFLDIACFFVGLSKSRAKYILNSCGFAAELELSILSERCLLSETESGELEMHDLIQEMGKEIVRQESPSEPGERSRLWNAREIYEVLVENKGSIAVQGIKLSQPILKDMCLDTRIFSRMPNLRLLQMNHVQLFGSFEGIFEKLVWLCWDFCPLMYLPSTFHLQRLVTLNMRESNIREFGPKIKSLSNLQELNLSGSKHLIKSPDFQGATSLKVLSLSECSSLLEVQSSIGDLERLVELHLDECANLKDLPSSICSLKSLKKLYLFNCPSLRQLPAEFGKLECLEDLFLYGSAIRQLPRSFEKLKTLSYLNMKECTKRPIKRCWSYSMVPTWVHRGRNNGPRQLPPSSIPGLWSLKSLDLSGCNLEENDFPIDFGSLSSLNSLCLSKNSFSTLPLSLRMLSKLQNLEINNCKNLEIVRELPPNLEVLIAFRCTSLQKLPILSDFKGLRKLDISYCSKLLGVQGLEKLSEINVVGCKNLILKESFFKGHFGPDYHHVGVPDDLFPNWLWSSPHVDTSSSISLTLSSNDERVLLGILVWGALTKDFDVLDFYPFIQLDVKIRNTSIGANFTSPVVADEDFIWCVYIPKTSEFGSQLKDDDILDISFWASEEIRKCGVHPLYKEEIKSDEEKLSDNTTNAGIHEANDLQLNAIASETGLERVCQSDHEQTEICQSLVVKDRVGFSSYPAESFDEGAHGLLRMFKRRKHA